MLDNLKNQQKGLRHLTFMQEKIFSILPQKRIAAPTAISMAIPFEYHGRIAARSGLIMRNYIVGYRRRLPWGN